MIFLYGAPGSGKSTLGKRLAKILSRDWIDLDERIVETSGRPIPQIFAQEGESSFRAIESETLSRTVCEANADAIVSLGGGTLLSSDNRNLCEKAGTVICLDTPDETELARRLGCAPGSRPLGDKSKERAAHYASFGSRIATTFEAGEGTMESLVVIGRGIAEPLAARGHVVADSNVARLYPQFRPMAVIPSGEEHKTPGTVAKLWSAFARAGLGRSDRVTALGGGVTGDLTGFAAATWMRGIDWINIPTTLLAMVDASTGGKTGCDLEEGKNLVGAFHAPKLVIIDTSFLKTLPPEILADGKSEMIKHEVIGGNGELPSPRLWRSSRGTGNWEREIAKSLKVKIGIVREDPFEKSGRRVLLNVGHTIGHAVEKLSGYAISHGKAVAIGCLEEARLAVRFGLADAAWPDELSSAFRKAGLETDLPSGFDIERLVPLMKNDKKKSSGDEVVFALPCGWGDARAVKVNLSKGLEPC